MVRIAKLAAQVYAPLGTGMSLGDYVRVSRVFLEGFKMARAVETGEKVSILFARYMISINVCLDPKMETGVTDGSTTASSGSENEDEDKTSIKRRAERANTLFQDLMVSY